MRQPDRECPFYTPQELAQRCGFTSRFILKEIQAGHIVAALIKPNGRARGRWKITRCEAARYLTRLGI